MALEKFLMILGFINENITATNLIGLIINTFDINLNDLNESLKHYLAIDYDTYIDQLTNKIEVLEESISQSNVSREHEQEFFHNHLSEILEYIDSKLSSATVKDTASHFGLDQQRFSMMFLQETNMNFSEYVLFIRNKISTNLDTMIIDLIIDYINSNISTVTVEEVIKKFNLSLSYLNYLFNIYLQTYIKDFIYYRKVLIATLFLKKTKATDEQLTEVLNFSSPTTFAYHFKKVFNCTPREYCWLNGFRPCYHTMNKERILVINMK